MSQQNNWNAIIEEIRRAIATINGALDQMSRHFSETDGEETADAVEFETLFEVLKKLSEDGYRAEIKGLLTKHGVRKLSALPKEQYAAVLAEAEAIRDGK